MASEALTHLLVFHSKWCYHCLQNSQVDQSLLLQRSVPKKLSMWVFCFQFFYCPFVSFKEKRLRIWPLSHLLGIHSKRCQHSLQNSQVDPRLLPQRYVPKYLGIGVFCFQPIWPVCKFQRKKVANMAPDSLTKWCQHCFIQ